MIENNNSVQKQTISSQNLLEDKYRTLDSELVANKEVFDIQNKFLSIEKSLGGKKINLKRIQNTFSISRSIPKVICFNKKEFHHNSASIKNKNKFVVNFSDDFYYQRNIKNKQLIEQKNLYCHVTHLTRESIDMKRATLRKMRKNLLMFKNTEIPKLLFADNFDIDMEYSNLFDTDFGNGEHRTPKNSYNINIQNEINIGLTSDLKAIEDSSGVLETSLSLRAPDIACTLGELLQGSRGRSLEPYSLTYTPNGTLSELSAPSLIAYQDPMAKFKLLPTTTLGEVLQNGSNPNKSTTEEAISQAQDALKEYAAAYTGTEDHKQGKSKPSESEMNIVKNAGNVSQNISLPKSNFLVDNSLFDFDDFASFNEFSIDNDEKSTVSDKNTLQPEFLDNNKLFNITSYSNSTVVVDSNIQISSPKKRPYGETHSKSGSIESSSYKIFDDMDMFHDSLFENDLFTSNQNKTNIWQEESITSYSLSEKNLINSEVESSINIKTSEEVTDIGPSTNLSNDNKPKLKSESLPDLSSLYQYSDIPPEGYHSDMFDKESEFNDLYNGGGQINYTEKSESELNKNTDVKGLVNHQQDTSLNSYVSSENDLVDPDNKLYQFCTLNTQTSKSTRSSNLNSPHSFSTKKRNLSNMKDFSCVNSTGNSTPKASKISEDKSNAENYIIKGNENTSDLQNSDQTKQCHLQSTRIVPFLVNGAYCGFIPEYAFPRVHNINASAKLNTQIDLKEFVVRVRNAELNPRRVNACVLRIRNPKGTVLIYPRGKLMICGHRSVQDAKHAAMKTAKLVQSTGVTGVRLTNFCIETIVGMADVRFPVRIEEIADEHSDFAQYEPEVSSGLIYRLLEPRVSLLVFVSGKVILSGARTEEALREAFVKIYPLLFKYRQ